jgi:hypothetical protein
MTATLETIHRSVRRRLDELRPLVTEAERLERAVAALGDLPEAVEARPEPLPRRPRRKRAVQAPAPVEPPATAVQALAAVLANGPRLATEVKAELARDGLSEYQVTKARRALGVHVERQAFQGPSIWSLPVSVAS